MILDDKYRIFSAVSNSAMKDFVKDGPKLYFDKYVDPMRIAQAEMSTEGTDIGDLVDCLTTQASVFNDFYYIMGDVPGDAVKSIMEAARNKAIHDWTHDPYDCSVTLSEALTKPEVLYATQNKRFLLEAAKEYVNPKDGTIGYRNNFKDDTLIEYLLKNGTQYYTDLATAAGRRIIDQELHNRAVGVEKAFRAHDIIGPILWPSNEEKGVEINKQHMITVEIDGILCKILLDYDKIDHNNKVIYPKDVKTSISHKQFMINYYKLMYGQQGSFYTAILKATFPGYTIAPFEFIVGCTESGESPMIYRMSETEIQLQKLGAITKSGLQVPGWLRTLEQLKWHYNNGTWLYPKEFYDNGYILLNSYSTEAIEAMGMGSSSDDVL